MLDNLLHACEGVRPELDEEIGKRLERLESQRIRPAGPLPALGHQAGPLEDGEELAGGPGLMVRATSASGVLPPTLHLSPAVT